jgi:nucleoside-diphosphate-sugar epimerase
VYLVTGGAGFIGSHTVEALVELGERVRVMDDLSTGSQRNLAGVADRIEFVEGGVSDPEALEPAMRDVEVVLHLAAIPMPPRSVADPLGTHEVNATGALRVLVAARDAGARRVVVASSSSVYGDLAPDEPKREDMPARPLSPYGVQKLAAESYTRVFGELYDVETVALRYFNVFGPRQDPSSPYSGVVSRFITAMLAGERPTIYGDGLQTRALTYVADIVGANIAAAESTGAGGRIINIARGDRMSVLDLCALVAKIMGTDAEPVFEPPRPGDIRHSYAATGLAEEVLGWRAETSVEEGLRSTVRWYESGS